MANQDLVAKKLVQSDINDVHLSICRDYLGQSISPASIDAYAYSDIIVATLASHKWSLQEYSDKLQHMLPSDSLYYREFFEHLGRALSNRLVGLPVHVMR